MVSKKIISFIVAGLGITAGAFASDKTIHIVSPFSTTGSVGKMSVIIHPKLEEKGWKIKFESLGNCAAANAIVNKGEPVIYYWNPENHAYANGHPCHQTEVSEKEVVAVLFNAPYYLCSVGKNQDLFSLPEGSKVRFGTGVVGNPPQKVINDIMAKTKATAAIANYENTGTMDAGVVSGEIDYLFGQGGYGLEGKGLVSCQYNTAGKNIGNSKPLVTVSGSPIVIQSGTYMSSRNLSEDTLKALRADIQEIIKGSEFTSFIKGRGVFDHLNYSNAKDQAEFLNKIGNEFKAK